MSLVAHDCYIDEYGGEGNEVQGSNRSVGQAKAKVNHQYLYLSARSICYRTAPESVPRISVHTKDTSRQKVLDRPKRLPGNSQNIANRERDVRRNECEFRASDGDLSDNYFIVGLRE